MEVAPETDVVGDIQQKKLTEDQEEDEEVNSDDTEIIRDEEEANSEVTEVLNDDDIDAMTPNENDAISSGHIEVPTNQREVDFGDVDMSRNEIAPQQISVNISPESPQEDDETSNVVNNKIRCKICNMEMKSKYHLNGHMRTHKRKKFMLDKPVRCKICNQLFRHQFHLNGHMNGHKVKNNSSAPPPAEPSTGSPLTVSPARKISKTNYRDLANGPLYRIFTGKSVSSKVKRKPVKKLDFQLEPFQCRICKKICKHRFHLNGHMRSHKEILDKQKIAESLSQSQASSSSPPQPRVGESTNNNSTILATIPTNNTVKKRKSPRKLYQKQYPYKCSTCPYKTTASLSLTLHVRLVHEGVVPHKCEHCWKSFPTQMRLQVHCKEVHVARKSQQSYLNNVTL